MRTLDQIAEKWPNEVKALASVTGEQRERFEKWMDELNAEHEKRGFPYGDRHVAEATGIACWLGYFDDGFTAQEALDEDLSYNDD